MSDRSKIKEQGIHNSTVGPEHYKRPSRREKQIRDPGRILYLKGFLNTWFFYQTPAKLEVTRLSLPSIRGYLYKDLVVSEFTPSMRNNFVCFLKIEVCLSYL